MDCTLTSGGGALVTVVVGKVVYQVAINIGGRFELSTQIIYYCRVGGPVFSV